MGRESIQFLLLQTALRGEKNNNTIKAYKKDVKRFTLFCRENGVNTLEKLEMKSVEMLQSYEVYLEKKEYSPNSIHRMLAAPCKGLGINMSEIKKPCRKSGTIVRGRRDDANIQGKMESKDPRFGRLMEFQKAIGLRRSELAKLTGSDLVKDESGYWCVRVKKGKGGKLQLQRILPEDTLVIKATFEGIGVDQKVFSKDEMKNKINLHRERALQARKAYGYYLNRLEQDPDYRMEALSELKMRYIAYNRGNVAEWLKESVNRTPYVLRGDNRSKAIKSGLPVEYNRLALMMVSVFHLSHWRLDVTVTNYMI